MTPTKGPIEGGIGFEVFVCFSGRSYRGFGAVPAVGCNASILEQVVSLGDALREPYRLILHWLPVGAF